MKYYLINIKTTDYIEVTDNLTVGRKESCTVTLNDDLVSGRHCRFYVNERLIFIEDLNASNPVQINDEQLNPKERKKLKLRDKLKIGSTQYLLSKKNTDNDFSNKSVVLEKVKIHETFDFDSDYDKNKKYWNEVATQKESEIVKIQGKIKKVETKKVLEKDLNKELIQIELELKTLKDKISQVKKYTEEEIIEKIDYYTERIAFFTEKKDEAINIKNINNQLSQLNENKNEIISKIKKRTDIDREHEELSKLYSSEVHALSLINAKRKK